MKKAYWGIYYTDHNFQRKRYMNIGFETKEATRIELNKILKQRKGSMMPHSRIIKIERAGLNVSAVLAGTDWRIKKIKIK